VPLAEVARFATLSEALVAKSALDANGIPATVFDTFTGSNLWTHQYALSGVRLVAHVNRTQEARAFLGARRIVAEDVSLDVKRSPALGDISLFLLALFLYGGVGVNAYCLTQLRARVTPVRLAVFTICVAITFLPGLLLVSFARP
jgi:hypothetical protein